MVKLDPEAQPAAPCILVVEDDISIRIVIADELREAGFCVIEADRADEALCYVNAGGRVDLVFSDIQTPGQLDGLDLARGLRQRHPILPIILTSGTILKQHADGVGIYIPKPYRVQETVALVRSTLAMRK